MNQENPAHSPLRIALTRIEVIVVVGTFAILIVLFMIMLPSMSRRGRISPRSVCAANLKVMGTAFYTYANENNDMWPNCGPPIPEKEGSLIQVTYAPKLIGKNRERSDADLVTGASGGSLQMSVTRNLWMLIRLQMSTQKSFVCPFSDDKANEVADPLKYWDFSKYSEVSYGYQVPFGRLGQPSSELDLRVLLAADKGPYGAALEGGRTNPGPPTAGAAATPEKWKPWNSPNHAGEGQNVLFTDAHVDWSSQPTVGVKDDNIYTRWTLPTSDPVTNTDNPLARIHGLPPTGTEVPASDTDTLIYP